MVRINLLNPRLVEAPGHNFEPDIPTRHFCALECIAKIEKLCTSRRVRMWGRRREWSDAYVISLFLFSFSVLRQSSGNISQMFACSEGLYISTICLYFLCYGCSVCVCVRTALTSSFNYLIVKSCGFPAKTNRWLYKKENWFSSLEDIGNFLVFSTKSK